MNCLSLVAHITKAENRTSIILSKENHKLFLEIFLYIIYTISHHMKQLCYFPGIKNL